jgi:hypothetical protein
MTKKTNVAQWFVIGCGGAIILAYISVSLVFRSASNSWHNQLATLIATDDSITAPGDGAHAVSINPDEVLNVGDSSTVFGVEITLDNAGFIKSAENYLEKMDYWFIEFTGKSVSDSIQYGVNPGVESQLQYLHGNDYIWIPDDYGQGQCNYDNVIDGFEMGETFHCRLVYLVPADERSLYWVYARTDSVDGSYEERFVVFQIR